jgi:hypothetical protein
MPVIEAQCASILVPHDHRHINQMRTFSGAATMHIYTLRAAICPLIQRLSPRRVLNIWMLGMLRVMPGLRRCTGGHNLAWAKCIR